MIRNLAAALAGLTLSFGLMAQPVAWGDPGPLCRQQEVELGLCGPADIGKPLSPGGPGNAAPAAPVTNAITLAFSPANLGSIVATVSNSSDLNANCHYSSQPIDSPRDFNVPAHGSTPLTFTGLNAGINYTATVTCNDASGKQTVPLGTSTQNVRF